MDTRKFVRPEIDPQGAAALRRGRPQSKRVSAGYTRINHGGTLVRDGTIERWIVEAKARKDAPKTTKRKRDRAPRRNSRKRRRDRY